MLLEDAIKEIEEESAKFRVGESHIRVPVAVLITRLNEISRARSSSRT